MYTFLKDIFQLALASFLLPTSLLDTIGPETSLEAKDWLCIGYGHLV